MTTVSGLRMTITAIIKLAGISRGGREEKNDLYYLISISSHSIASGVFVLLRLGRGEGWDFRHHIGF
jgi:hypothetical protein